MNRNTLKTWERFAEQLVPGLLAVVAVLSIVLAAGITARLPAMLEAAQQRAIAAAVDPSPVSP